MGMKGEVGSRKVFEDEDVIVWEFELAPGETTPCHTHELDYVWYVLEGTTLEVFDEQNQFLGTLDASTGSTFALRCENGELISTDDRGLRAPATHSARNGGTGHYREILVEKKRRPAA